VIDGRKSIEGNLAFPVAACSWNRFLFVADEQNMKLRLFKRMADGNWVESTVLQAMTSYLQCPLGLSVNRSSCLVVADRAAGCCWVVDLKEVGLS
jgi:hypothetical protein